MKQCSRCVATKAFDLFSKNASSPDGRHSVCKQCRKVTAQEYRARPDILEKEKSRLAAAYIANRDELLERRKLRYQNNRQKERQQNIKWRENNLELHRKMCRDWAKNNPLAARALTAKRRTLRLGNGGSYTKQDIQAMLHGQDGRCAACDDVLTSYHVDHVIPLSRGGSSNPENLQLLCPVCNRSKGNKLPHEFEQYRAQKHRVHSQSS